ncbi:MAG TPA: PfkB family carbohydrate kinase [Gemmataceae bacterium]|nr:PfkB family carbohydrate kinase [Gemmataceae bacterium]
MDDTKRQLEPLRAKRNPVVIGTGLVALDVVIPSSLETDPQLRAGGTCGNVLTALAYLGWGSYPIARLSEDGASKLVAADLRQWGVQLDFVTFDDDGSTPVIVQHIRNSKTGAPSHSFSRKCPCCGAILPWYKALRVADVTDLVPRLPKPQVYFFDRISRGALTLARQSRKLGAVVFFEPSASSEPNLLKEALELAHIVKLSSDRIGGNEAVLTATKPKIIIETRGSAGLRLRHTDSERERGGNKWHEVSAIPVDRLRDTAGAGDWCTAGIIHMLGAMGAKGLTDLTLAEVRQAVQIGQAMASWTCGFDGARGGMYGSEKAAFQGTILGLANGRTDSAADMKRAASLTRERQVFTCESCRAKDKPQSSVRKSRR